MCEFFLKGQCFHPKRVSQGKISTPCEAHACTDCTSTDWKETKVKNDICKLQELIQLTQQKEENTTIFG